MRKTEGGRERETAEIRSDFFYQGIGRNELTCPLSLKNAESPNELSPTKPDP
jgi:hypothetical protein